MSRGHKETWGEKAKRIGLPLLFLPLLLPLLAVTFTLVLLNRTVLYVLVWLLWSPRRKTVLVIYSDSTVWREYFENELIPLLQDKAVVLNWSQRMQWRKWSLKVRVFRSFGGRREFNPMVMVFRPFRLVQRFRFGEPFKQWKRGNRYPVDRLKLDLFDLLELPNEPAKS